MVEDSASAGQKLQRLIEIIAQLREPGGWARDREQSFDTIKKSPVEETIDRRDWVALREELGDFIMQAVFYAQMASGPTASPLTGSAFLYAKSVEVHFTPEQEAQIVQAARVTGTDAARLVQHIAMRFADDANFRAGVLEAKEYADRGEFIEEDEMDRRFEEMLRS